MRRTVEVLVVIAALGFTSGIMTWPGSFAVAMLVAATAAVLGALFAWFRLDDLGRSERLGR